MRKVFSVKGLALCSTLCAATPSIAETVDLYFDKTKLMNLLESAEQGEGDKASQGQNLDGEDASVEAVSTDDGGAVSVAAIAPPPASLISNSVPIAPAESAGVQTCTFKVSEIGDEIKRLRARLENSSDDVSDLRRDVSHTMRMLNSPREDGVCEDPTHDEILELKDELFAVEADVISVEAESIMLCVVEKIQETKAKITEAEGDNNRRLQLAAIEGLLTEMDSEATALARESAALRNEVGRYREGITNASVQCEIVDY